MSNCPASTYAYKIGDHIMYLSSGVCLIDDIRDETFGGTPARTYYVMHALSDPKSVIYVPTDSEKLVSSMLPLLSKEELEALISDLDNTKIEWIPDIKQRAAYFSELVSEGSRPKIFALLKSLYSLKLEFEAQKKRFYASDERVLNSISKLVCEECSIVLEIEYNAVIDYIMSHS